jgi:serine/threonine protein kinase/Tol biopolymer transport system component
MKRAMPLAPGTRLGPYEVLSPLGAGGMGEVFRARDTRLNRDVALKILPAAFAEDPDRLRRFELEAQATGQLSHPNIVAVYDFGRHDGAIYVVIELLEGDTLRARLSSPITARKAADYAVQIARGLAAAHAKGITHRDIKPENVFLTTNGFVKILDFGLAKVAAAKSAPGSAAPTTPLETDPGVVVGTAAYMSPEQVRGAAIDPRSDIFSLGAVLYEMLTGKRAFTGGSAVEVMSAILKDEPAEVAIAPALDCIARRCLEKDPARRFQTAQDLAFALENADTSTGPKEALKQKRDWRPLAFATGAFALAVLSYLAGARPKARPEPPLFQRLTFGHGVVTNARVAPEGRTIVYTASWEGRPSELFMTRLDSRESRPLGIQNAEISSISSLGEMALLLCKDRDLAQCVNWQNSFVLARAPLAGGAPREILDNVGDARWTPDGSDLAVVHSVNGKTRIEFPIGNAVYETEGYINGTAMSPDGTLFAFAEVPVGGNEFRLNTVDRKGKLRTISAGWPGQGFFIMGWASSRELWVAPQPGGTGARELDAVDVDGNRRVLARVPGLMFLSDITPDGRALVAQGNYRVGLSGIPPGENRERDFSWLDASEVDDISADGKTLLITEFADGGDPNRWSIYQRRVDESLPVRLGEGLVFALSSDGTRVVSMRQSSPPAIVILPTGAGESQTLQTPGFAGFGWAGWLPNGKDVVFLGAANVPGHPVGLYVQSVSGASPHLIARVPGAGQAFAYRLVAPDGRTAVTPDALGRLMILPLDGGAPRPVPGAQPGDHPMLWSPDSKYYYFVRPNMPRAEVMKVELATGRTELWKEIAPADPARLSDIYGVKVANDGKSYYYSYTRILNDLYLIDGLK